MVLDCLNGLAQPLIREISHQRAMRRPTVHGHVVRSEQRLAQGSSQFFNRGTMKGVERRGHPWFEEQHGLVRGWEDSDVVKADRKRLVAGAEFL